MSSQMPAIALHGPPFRCTVRSGVRAVWLEASGELDAVSAPDLERALRDLESSALVVLDLDALTFMDLAGLRVIHDANALARLDGRRFVVSRAPRHVLRMLDLTGVGETVERLDVEAPGRLRLVR